MIFLRQSTASQEFALGYFVDSTDGNTEETGLTIANTDIKIHKAGATTLANKNSGGGTHISNGIFYCTFDATDTDTVGSGTVFVHVSGALAFQKDICVLPAAIYDWLFGVTANLPVNVTQFGGSNGTFSSGRPEVNTTHLGGTLQTARDIGASVLLSSGTGTGQVSLSSGLVRLSSTGVADILTTQATQAYRADGSAPTLAQFMCETLAHLGEASISGTTKTLKQFDGSTSAMTFTLDSATTPTSITRAT